MNLKLKAAIDAGDVDAARVAIRAIADEDMYRDNPQMIESANEADRALLTKGVSLYEEDDGRFVMPPESDWNENLLHKIRGGLDWNFSKLRLECLQKVTVRLHEKQKTIAADPFAPARERTVLNPRSSEKSGKRVGFWILCLVGVSVVTMALIYLLSRN